jgi:hypothetical protein
MHAWPRVASFAGAMLLAGLAFADDTSHGVATEERWYGWQILVPEAVGYTGVYLLVKSDHSQTAGQLMLGTYLLTGPVVHAVHRRPGWAVGSLGLRAGLALGVGSVGAVVGGLGGAVVGVVGGGVCAEVIDVAGFANETVEVRGIRAVPAISVDPHGGSLGLRGWF